MNKPIDYDKPIHPVDCECKVCVRRAAKKKAKEEAANINKSEQS